ncbi:hypothetical protein [Stenotrophomonas maltophilia]|uniref:hypothetical protein n=1 Tax=Stenotrophomonas maltophilia TaxID=40324 RepID=UPI000DA72A78|nr:hypothetical protein [Stenotrophomonas maltophilia]PZS48884.1 hypothetical protein A7X60_06595 [Stenotrophomonas maltophilia]
MAKKIVTPEQAGPKIELANDTHWIESSWNDNPLPEFIKGQLHRIERCVIGASTVALVLHRFAMGMEDVEATGDGDDFRVVYPTLSKDELDRLRIGMHELLEVAETTIEHVRDDPQGIIAAMMKESAHG